MKNITIFSVGLFITFLTFFLSCTPKPGEGQMEFIKEAQMKKAINELVAAHSEDERVRIERGVKQIIRFWRLSRYRASKT